MAIKTLSKIHLSNAMIQVPHAALGAIVFLITMIVFCCILFAAWLALIKALESRGDPYAGGRLSWLLLLIPTMASLLSIGLICFGVFLYGR